MLAEAATVTAVIFSVLAINKRIKRIAAERVFL